MVAAVDIALAPMGLMGEADDAPERAMPPLRGIGLIGEGEDTNERAMPPPLPWLPGAVAVGVSCFGLPT